MDTEAGGSYLACVVRLERAADGRWQIRFDGTPSAGCIPLAPLTLVVRAYRDGALRGTLSLPDGSLVVPFQASSQLDDLLRAWLLGGGPWPGAVE